VEELFPPREENTIIAAAARISSPTPPSLYYTTVSLSPYLVCVTPLGFVTKRVDFRDSESAD